MIADSSKPNKLRNVYTIVFLYKKARRGTPPYKKREKILYQNQILVYHLTLEETNPFAIERCKSKKGTSESVVLALFNCSSGG